MSSSDLILLDALELWLLVHELDAGGREQIERSVRLKGLAAQHPEMPPGLAAEVVGELRRGAAGCESLAAELARLERTLEERRRRVLADLADASPSYALRRAEPRLVAARKPKESYWEGVKRRAGALYGFVLGDAIRTLRDPNASARDKALALASLPGPGKAGAAVVRGASRLRKAENAADAARATGAARARIARLERTIENIKNEQLTQATLNAARRERAGEVVARKAGGTPFDHVRKVRAAQRGLRNAIGEINRQLANPHLHEAERQRLLRALSEASRLLDRSERYVARR